MADNSLNILIVDDHDIVLRGMHHLLLDIMGEGCRVDCSSTAAKALLLAAANHYNLCLLDIELPDSPGIDLVNRLRQASPGMKIIVNTIHEELWLVKEYFDANVEGILFPGEKAPQKRIECQWVVWLILNLQEFAVPLRRSRAAL